MDPHKIRAVLGWCTVLNYCLLLISVLIFLFAHDWVYSFHSSYFNVSVETYDALWFMTIAFWKAMVFIFNLMPYVALRIVYKTNHS